MILDPNRSGMEVFYDGKIRNLEGHPTNIVNWIIEMTCEKVSEVEDEDYKVDDDLFSFGTFMHKEELWVQYACPYLDVKAVGRLYVDLFNEIGYIFDEANVEKVRL